MMNAQVAFLFCVVTIACALIASKLKEKRHKILILLDWDHTILPSEIIRRAGLTLTSTKEQVQESDLHKGLTNLADKMAGFIEILDQFGKVVIVTNAQYRWVELSAELFVPKVSSVLKTLSIPIVSAHTRFFHLTENCWKKSKQMAFESLNPSQYEQVLSIGDSQAEREAIWAIKDNFAEKFEIQERPLFKSVKLIDDHKCTIENMQQQIQVLAMALPSILSDAHDMDLQIS